IIPGCLELTPRVMLDERGSFVKTFHQGMFSDQGLETRFAEEYYSRSRRGVLRGLHFQMPPHDHIKMVYCVSGSVLDVVVDLRKGSPAYGRHVQIELTADKANMLYIPRGLAHGFFVTGDHAIMLYNVTTVYAPEHDSGIRWDSAGIPWPSTTPIISKRDGAFPSLADFTSPFTFPQEETT
nr:dTDP-4-dehydrorhamnose 3,5-epimerase [Nitrospiraceae bacterium]